MNLDSIHSISAGLLGGSVLVDQCAGVQKGEQIAIVADYESLDLAEIITGVCIARGAVANTLVMPIRARHGEEPPSAIRAAMAGSDVAFQITKRSIAHTEATQYAKGLGTRIIVMPEYSIEMFLAGGLTANFEKEAPRCERMRECLTSAKVAHLTSKAGSDLTMDLTGRPGRALTGLAKEKGGYACPPNIEASIAPLETKANGKIVVDCSIAGIGLLKEKVTIYFKDGQACKIEGGAEAVTLDKMLKDAKDPTIYSIAELGIGMNPNAIASGRMLDDEGFYGSVHVALGSNKDFGGINRSAGHIDNIMYAPTLDLDGKVVLKDGVIFPV